MDMNSNPSTSSSSSPWELEIGAAAHHHLFLDPHPPYHDLFPHHHHHHPIPDPYQAHTLFPPTTLPISQLLDCDQRDHDSEKGYQQNEDEEEEEALGAMKEMIYRIAAMQPVDIDPATLKKPKRRNVRISDDPQSIAARHRRERISERIRILQRLVPGGTKMDTASMLDEAIRYVKFLKKQVQELQSNPQPQIPVVGSQIAIDWTAVPHDPNIPSTSPSSSQSGAQHGLGFGIVGDTGDHICSNYR